MSFVASGPPAKARPACLNHAWEPLLAVIFLGAAQCCLSQEVYTPSTDRNVFTWFKADALTLTNGAKVSAWYPSGGVITNAEVQMSSSNQPTFLTNQQNGLPAVFFDGVASYMTVLGGWAAPQNQPLTIFLVYEYLGPVNPDGNSFLGNMSGAYSWDLGASSLEIPGYIYMWNQTMSSSNNALCSLEQPIDATWHIVMVVWNGSNSLSRANGYTNTPFSGTMGNLPLTSLELGGHSGASFFGNILLGEIIIYNGDQSLSNEDNIFSYLTNRWNISLAPPPGPPPFTLNWPDRRPLGMDILGNTRPTTNNPRGWFIYSNNDYVSPSGIIHFSNDLMARGSNEVTVLKSMNAQGIIIWTPEGCELENMNWIGDPRKVSLLAPEMDMAADAFFGLFRAAGLKIGVCLRPRLFDAGPALPSGTNGQTFVLTTAPFGLKTYYYTNGWVQTNAVPYGGDTFSAYLPDLTNKMEYAVKRWGASIFYIDSFGAIDDYGPQVVQALTNIARAYPNVLLIPEMGGAKWTNIFCASAPYLQPQYTGYLVPTNILSVYPNAWSVICVNDYHDYPSMVKSVKAGNIMLANSWFPNSSAQGSGQAYIDAGIVTPLQSPTGLHVVTNSP